MTNSLYGVKDAPEYSGGEEKHITVLMEEVETQWTWLNDSNKVEDLLNIPMFFNFTFQIVFWLLGFVFSNCFFQRF
jgi:hypothetical protein